MRSQRLQLFAAVLVIVVAGSSNSQRLPERQEREMADLGMYIGSSGRLRAKETKALRERLARAQARLPGELKKARALGMAITPVDMRRPVAPRGKDAAPDYVELTARLKDRPIDKAVEALYSKSGPLTRNAVELTKIESLLNQRNDLLELIDRAAAKPTCVFQRDWSQGAAVLLPEYAAMRQGVRLLRGESLIESRHGRPMVAVRHLKMAFQVTRHAASEQIAIAHLVGLALEAITLEGLRQVIMEHASDEHVIQAVSDTVHSGAFAYDLAAIVKRENIMPCTELRRLANAGTFAMVQYLTSENPSRDPPQNLPLPGESRMVQMIFEGIEARYLELARPVVAASRLSSMDRVREFRRLYRRQLRPGLPDGLANIFAIDWALAAEKELGIHAKEAVLCAGAAVLLVRKHQKTLPASLKDVTGSYVDPFTNRPLKYRREGARGFVIYSVGPSERFGGGKPGVKPPTREAIFRFP